VAQNNVFRKKQFQFFRRNLAVDIGSSFTTIWSPRKGLLLHEPTVLAVDARYGKIDRAGKEAWEMVGRNPQNISIIKPVRAGVIAQFNYTVKMLKTFFNMLLPRSPLVKVRLIMTIPFGTTPVERQAVITTGKRIGMKEIYLIEEPLAAAMGAGIPVEEAKGSMIINLGGGITEIALLSLGGIVKCTTIRQGGETIDAALQRHIYKKYRVEIGQATASRLKEEAGYAMEAPENETYELKGFNRQSRRPDRLSIPLTEISEAIEPIISNFTTSVKKTFELAPPQIASDIIKNGIFLSGGVSLLKNIDKLLSKELDLKVKKVDDPFYNPAKGASKAVSFIVNKRHLDFYRA